MYWMFPENTTLQVFQIVVAQYSQSAIILKKILFSIRKRTKHINVRYDFIEYRIEKGKLEVGYCLNDKNLADFFVKTVQGIKFIKYRNQILKLED